MASSKSCAQSVSHQTGADDQREHDTEQNTPRAYGAVALMAMARSASVIAVTTALAGSPMP